MKQPPSAGASSPSILSATLAGTPGGQAARPLVSMDKPVTFDGLVPSALLRSLHGDMRDRSTFAYGRVSNLSDESIKAWGLNVVHECRVMIPEHMRTCMLLFRLVEDKLMEAGLMTVNWRMYRIGFDARTEGQHGYIHPDHTAGNMLSVLYYVNSEWRPEWHGQTCFYADGTPPDLCHKHQPAFTVDYVPGRFAVFPSRMLHSSTAPTDGNTGLRITLTYVLEIA